MKKIIILITIIIMSNSIFAQQKSDQEVIDNVKKTVKAIIELDFMVKYSVFKADMENATVALASEFALQKDSANYITLQNNYITTQEMCDNFIGMIARDLSDVGRYNYFQEHLSEKQLEYTTEFNKIITQYNENIYPFYKEHTQIYRSPILAVLVELAKSIVIEIAKYVIVEHVKPWLSNKILQIVTNRLLKPFYFTEWKEIEKLALSNPATGEYMQAPITISQTSTEKVKMQPNIRNELNGNIQFRIIYNDGQNVNELINFNKNNNVYSTQNQYSIPNKMAFQIEINNPSCCYIFTIHNNEFYRIYPYPPELRQAFNSQDRGYFGPVPENAEAIITIPPKESGQGIWTEFKEDYFYVILSKSLINLEKDVFPFLDTNYPASIPEDLDILFSNNIIPQNNIENNKGKVSFTANKTDEKVAVFTFIIRGK